MPQLRRISSLKWRMRPPKSLRNLSIGLLISLLASYYWDETTTNYINKPHHVIARSELNDFTTKASINSLKIVDKDPFENVKQNRKQKVIRPRYYATELGVRKKLFVGVLSHSKDSYDNFVAIHRTLNQNVDMLVFFAPKVHSSSDEDLIVHEIGYNGRQSFLVTVIELIAQRYLENFDYVFLVKDNVYVHGGNLLKFLSKISSSHDVFAGSGYMCSIASGMVFSNSVFKSVYEATKDVVTITDDEDQFMINLVKSGSGMSCSTIKLMNSTRPFPEDIGNFSISSINSVEEIYMLHIEVCRQKIDELKKQKLLYQNEVSHVNKKLDESHKLKSWPIGSEDSYPYTSRFDFLNWQYFNLTHLFFPNEKSVIKQLTGVDRLDINNIFETSKLFMQDKIPKNFAFSALLNGYKKVDLTRGIDYLLDLEYCDRSVKNCISHRVHLFKEFSKMELINVPYVTENIITTIVIPVTHKRLERVDGFMKYLTSLLASGGAKLRIMFILIRDGDTEYPFSKVKMNINKLHKKHEHTGTRVNYLEFHLPGIGADVPQLLIMDLITYRLNPNSLIIYVHPELIIKEDFVNRVRMSTISGFQVFFPVPFILYNPAVTIAIGQNQQFKIHKDYGHYDTESYDYASFYFSDFLEARKLVASVVPIIRKQRDFLTYPNSMNQFNLNLVKMFLKLKHIHIFRAVDKSMLVYYSKIECSKLLDFEAFEKCQLRKVHSHGNFKQLAVLYLENSKFI